MRLKQFIFLVLEAFIFFSICIILFRQIPRYYYSYSNEYEGYIITKAYGYEKTYTIPENYKNKPIVGIGVRAFYDKDSLTKIIFKNPNNIKVIKKLAFYSCNNLKNIELDNVYEIGRNAFDSCTKLDNIRISTHYLGASAFFNCKSLSNIELLDGINNIGSMAFYNTKISIIDLPESVEDVYINAFKGMEYLEKIIVNNEALKDNAYLKTLDNVEYR